MIAMYFFFFTSVICGLHTLSIGKVSYEETHRPSKAESNVDVEALTKGALLDFYIVVDSKKKEFMNVVDHQRVDTALCSRHAFGIQHFHTRYKNELEGYTFVVTRARNDTSLRKQSISFSLVSASPQPAWPIEIEGGVYVLIGITCLVLVCFFILCVGVVLHCVCTDKPWRRKDKTPFDSDINISTEEERDSNDDDDSLIFPYDNDDDGKYEEEREEGEDSFGDIIIPVEEQSRRKRKKKKMRENNSSNKKKQKRKRIRKKRNENV